jgi:hypothetical protein
MALRRYRQPPLSRLDGKWNLQSAIGDGLFINACKLASHHTVRRERPVPVAMGAEPRAAVVQQRNKRADVIRSDFETPPQSMACD